MELEDIAKEIGDIGFSLIDKLYKNMIHDDNYTTEYVLNFQRVID